MVNVEHRQGNDNETPKSPSSWGVKGDLRDADPYQSFLRFSPYAGEQLEATAADPEYGIKKHDRQRDLAKMAFEALGLLGTGGFGIIVGKEGDYYVSLHPDSLGARIAPEEVERYALPKLPGGESYEQDAQIKTEGLLPEPDESMPVGQENVVSSPDNPKPADEANVEEKIPQSTDQIAEMEKAATASRSISEALGGDEYGSSAKGDPEVLDNDEASDEIIAKRAYNEAVIALHNEVGYFLETATLTPQMNAIAEAVDIMLRNARQGIATSQGIEDAIMQLQNTAQSMRDDMVRAADRISTFINARPVEAIEQMVQSEGMQPGEQNGAGLLSDEVTRLRVEASVLRENGTRLLDDLVVSSRETLTANLQQAMGDGDFTFFRSALRAIEEDVNQYFNPIIASASMQVTGAYTRAMNQSSRY